jgi:dipeptidyl aminopeptidase/acylaminoacyl peptidase
MNARPTSLLPLKTLIYLLAVLFGMTEVSQAQEPYPLPGPGYDIGLSDTGVVVVSPDGGTALWIRDTDGSTRTVTVEQFRSLVRMKKDGSTGYLLGTDTPNLFILDVALSQLTVRSFEALPTSFDLTPDGANVVVGLSDNNAIVSDTVNFFDGLAIPLNETPRAVAATPNSKFAFVAGGASSTTYSKVKIATREVVQAFSFDGGVEALKVSPSGKVLYALTLRSRRDGSTARSLVAIDARTLEILARRPIQIAGATTPRLDLEVGARNIFISSSEPITVGARRAGVIRFPVRRGVIGRARTFALNDSGAGAISYSERLRRIAIIDPAQQSVRVEVAP